MNSTVNRICCESHAREDLHNETHNQLQTTCCSFDHESPTFADLEDGLSGAQSHHRKSNDQRIEYALNLSSSSNDMTQNRPDVPTLDGHDSQRAAQQERANSRLVFFINDTSTSFRLQLIIFTLLFDPF